MATEKEESTEVTREWSVELEVLAAALDEDLADRLIDYFAAHDRGPAVSLEQDRVSVRFNVTAETPNEAVHEAMSLFGRGFPELLFDRRGVKLGLNVVRAQVESVEELDRRLQQSNAPELLGLAEVAEELGVSKQRVSELASGENFPTPIARLKSGPVWQRSALARFMRSWKRAPGRPARAKH